MHRTPRLSYRPSGSVLAAALSIVALTVAACSGSASISIGGESPTEAATDLIQGEISDQAGLTFSDIECESPDDTEVGTTFPCTADSEAGTVDFIAEIDREDHLDVNSTNLVRADAVDAFEASAAAEVSASVGAELPTENFDCGDTTVVLDDSMTIDCTLTDPANGDVFDAVLTITDPDTGTFDIDVAEQPR